MCKIIFFCILLCIGISFELMEGVPHICDEEPGKGIGIMMQLQAFPHYNNKFYNKTSDLTGIDCKKMCLKNESCTMAWYNKGSHNKHGNCKLYNKTDYHHLNQNILFVWNRCNSTDLCNTVKNRCPGFWLRRNETKLTSYRGPIGSFSTKSINESLVKCIENDYCGSVTISSKLTHLNPGWPPSQIEMKSDQLSTTYEWTCCDVTHINSICNKTVREIWQRDIVTWSPNSYYIHQFYTLDRDICLTECKQHRLCLRAWYSRNTFLCLLEANPNRRLHDTCAHKLPIKKSDVTNAVPWKLVNCPQSELQIQSDGSEPSRESVSSSKLSCICIQNVSHVTVREEVCDKPDEISKARELINGMAFFTNKTEIRSNGQTWWRVFNGDRYGWLTGSKKGTKLCELEKCHLYSGQKSTKKNCTKFLPRSVWSAAKSKHLDRRTKPPTKVIISSTSTDPKCPCYTIACTTEYLRVLQQHDMAVNQYADIAANLVVSMDGNVYEGRGVNFVGEMMNNSAIDQESISILLLGEFQFEEPSQSALDNIKNIINCAQNREDSDFEYTMMNDYLLYAERDFLNDTISTTANYLPGQILYGILHNWPHYKGIYSGRDVSCSYKTPEWIIIVPSVLGSLLVLAVLIGVGLYFIKKQRQSEIERRYELCCRPITPSEDSEAFL